MGFRKFAGAILNGETITLFDDGKTARDYIFVADIMDRIMASVEWLKEEAK